LRKMKAQMPKSCAIQSATVQYAETRVRADYEAKLRMDCQGRAHPLRAQAALGSGYQFEPNRRAYSDRTSAHASLGPFG
jgi:hypothetical protein